jgi:hypothetical protein
MYTINDIFLGEPDGKKEAAYNSDFENFFFDYNNLYLESMKQKVFIILGRKGTGKSILGEFIKKQSNDDPEWFCHLISYKDFQFHALIQLENGDIRPNEYISIWEWVLLIELAKLCLENKKLESYDEYEKLRVFFSENNFSMDLNTLKIIEITKQRNISGNVLRMVQGGGNYTVKSERGNYLNYIEDLRNVVIKLLKLSGAKYTLICDELDDRFRNENTYKDSIISLIKAADKLNLLMINNNIDCKVMLLLRTDIFNILRDNDINKIRETNAIEIDWGTTVSRDAALFDLIIYKAKQSISELQEKTRDEVYNALFSSNNNGVSFEKFLLGRTFFRPRDVIKFLNLARNQFPMSRSFNVNQLKKIEDKYSSYFLKEIKDELCGHVSDDIMETGFLLLKQFNRFHFSYSDIKCFYEKDKRFFNKIDLDEMLKIFFDFGVIGNKWFNEYKNKDYYLWSFRERDNVAIDYNKTFVIHLGLRRALSL